MNEVTTTLIGNLADDPEMRFTSDGTAVCKFRMAQTPRTYDRNAGEFKDGEPFWINVTAWRDLGEHVAETLQRGMRVIVQATLKQRTFDHKDGYKVTVVEATADEVGVALRYATAKVTRAGKSSGGGSNGDDWGTASRSRPAGNSAQTAPANDGANADTQRAAQASGAATNASPW